MNLGARKQEESHARAIARRCIAEAKAMLGTGRAHVSRDAQHDLVMARVLGVVNGQCESIPAENVVRYMRELVCVASDLLDEGGA